MLLNILGFIALLVGVLVTIPITWLAVTHAYRTLVRTRRGAEPINNRYQDRRARR